MALAVSGQALVPPELRTEARRLLGDLAALRGLPTSGGPPPLVIQSTEERRRYVVAEFSRTYSPARIDAERRALVAWGLIPADFDLAVFLADLQAEQAAAYYDPGREADGPRELADGGDAARRPDPRARPRPPGPALRPRPVPGRRTGAKRRDRRPPRARRRRGRRPRAGPEPPPGGARLRRAAGRRRSSAGHPDVGQRPRRRAGARLHPDHAHVSLRARVSDSSTRSGAATRGRSCRRSTRTRRGPPRRSSTRSATSTGERIRSRSRLPDLAAILPAGSRLALEDELGEVGLAEVLRRFLGESADVSGLARRPPRALGPARGRLCPRHAHRVGHRGARRWRSRGTTRGVLTLKHGLAPRRPGRRLSSRGPAARRPSRSSAATAPSLFVEWRAAVRARRPPRGHLGEAGAILTAPRCRALRRRSSSEFPTPTPAGTTRSTTWSPSSRASAR